MRTVCKRYHQAQELHEQGVPVISTDEKTGIQALEPIHPSHPMRPSHPEAVEFEYERHGTQALIANVEVATGRVIAPSIGDTRTEADFVAHLAATVDTDPQAEWIFIGDQLNTHQPASLVEFVAPRCAIEGYLGRKEKEGILKSMASRAAFLQDPTHRIRFVYTPKHCSRLNQIEIWLGILTRRLLKRGRFASTEELKQRILAFITFFNQDPRQAVSLDLYREAADGVSSPENFRCDVLHNHQIPAASRSMSALSVRSQVKPGSVRPK